jgi:hypothetical protein
MKMDLSSYRAEKRMRVPGNPSAGGDTLCLRKTRPCPIPDRVFTDGFAAFPFPGDQKIAPFSTVFLPMGIGMRRLFDEEEECCTRLRDYGAFADASLKSGYPLEENGQKAKKYFRWTLKGEGGEYVLNFDFNERSERDDIDIFFSNICRCVLIPLALMPDRPVLSWLYVDERGVPRRGFAGDSFAVRQRMIV